MTIEKLPLVVFWPLYGLALFYFGHSFCLAYQYTVMAMPDQMPGVPNFFLSAMNILFAANLAMILGVRAALASKFAQTFVDVDVSIKVAQVLAVVVYVVAFGFALWIWSTTTPRFSDDETKIVANIPEIVRTVIAIPVVVIGAGLGIKSYLP